MPGSRTARAPDYEARMREILEHRKGVRYLPGAAYRCPAAIVGDDLVERPTLRELVLHLEARFR